jgi:hypothetical protein
MRKLSTCCRHCRHACRDCRHAHQSNPGKIRDSVGAPHISAMLWELSTCMSELSTCCRNCRHAVGTVDMHVGTGDRHIKVVFCTRGAPRTFSPCSGNCRHACQNCRQHVGTVDMLSELSTCLSELSTCMSGLSTGTSK